MDVYAEVREEDLIKGNEDGDKISFCRSDGQVGLGGMEIMEGWPMASPC
jgi:hypothetical protein